MVASTTLELLWKKKGIYKRPWQRQLLNIDFLKYEQKRISDVANWYNDHFLKVRPGASLNEVVYYVVPVFLDSYTKAAISRKGDFDWVGLSALRDCLELNVLMLLPLSLPRPSDYSLIRIIKSTKDYIHNEKIGEAHYVIKVDEYEQLEPDYVYLNIDFEKKSVNNFISEELIDEPNISASFQSVISSAPYVVYGKGGVTLSSFQRTMPFSDELFKTLKLMQPPEYTNLVPSRRLLEGYNVSTFKGIKFNLSERFQRSTSIFEGFNTSNYETLLSHLMKRAGYKGEYSLVCSLNPRGEGTELLNDILTKFVRTEITQPFTFDELKYNFDIDLFKTQQAIDEDLIIQIANQRQLKPSFDVNSSLAKKLKLSLYDYWLLLLEELGYTKNIEPVYRTLGAISFDNLVRVAQSFARDKGRIFVDEQEINKAWKLFDENSQQLINHPDIQHNLKIIPKYWEDKKFNAVRVELSLNSLNLQELFSNTSQYFKNFETLQIYVDKLIGEGWIYNPERSKYKWV